jgi:hypothetical protein
MGGRAGQRLGTGRVTDAEKLQWLYDRARITDVVTRFAVALDTRDWALHRTCFAETVTFDYPASGGHRVLKAIDLADTSPPFFEHFDATQHLSTNHQIEIDGDQAICTSTLHARHFRSSERPEPLQVQIGYYRNHLQRQDGDWKIFLSEQQVFWTEGNQALFDDAIEARRRRIMDRADGSA